MYLSLVSLYLCPIPLEYIMLLLDTCVWLYSLPALLIIVDGSVYLQLFFTYSTVAAH